MANTYLQQACRSERGISWQTFVNAKHQNLTGYAHGVSGIALALLELHAETGMSDFTIQRWKLCVMSHRGSQRSSAIGLT